MSSLKERLLDDMKMAMKSGEKQRLSVIRMARAAIKNQEIEKRKDLDDDEIIEVLSREVKQRRDAIAEYKKAGKEDIIAGLNKEIEILSEYLPEQLSTEELENLIQELINETGASSMKDIGRVMEAIMPKVKGRADGRIVNQMVQEKLSQ
ncbi:MAG: GatB/YqeY domain-containing protein [Halanaerobiaceae bacterium]|nr:GatB/YqeY domain-containing protein [Halanaerobiaceae bacterium]